MADSWRPNQNHKRYRKDPAYIEARFGLKPISELLDRDVSGIARFTVMPTFQGESIHTFIYRERELVIHSAVAESSLWDSLSGSPWTSPPQTSRSLPIDGLPFPLQNWQQLKEAALASPTVQTASIDGMTFTACDGVNFRHQILDCVESFDAEWSSLTPDASNHVRQMELVNAYNAVLNNA